VQEHGMARPAHSVGEKKRREEKEETEKKLNFDFAGSRIHTRRKLLSAAATAIAFLRQPATTRLLYEPDHKMVLQ